jgi:hypothetical protein
MKRVIAVVGVALLVAGLSGCRNSTTSPKSIVEKPQAMVEKPSRTVLGNPRKEVFAAIAGNVADADRDGKGDNHNALPGGAPVLIAAGVISGLPGGPGSNGTVRIHTEWRIASFVGHRVVSAKARFHTDRGSIDALDTQFFALSADGNGTLEDTDFESPGTPIKGAIMPVGAEGTFDFDVTKELQTAMDAGFSYFSVQGRVNESMVVRGAQRGLQVCSSAQGNINAGKTPSLIIVFAPE